MEERYGRVRPARTLKTLVFLAFTLFTGFVIWSGWHYATTSVRTQVVSFTSTDESMVLRYQITRRDGSTALSCRVTAQDYQRRVVGEITDVIPAGVKTATRIIEVPTLKAAAAGFVGPCEKRSR